MSNKEEKTNYNWLEKFRFEQIKQSSRNPGLASLMSFFVMGLGQIYAGHIDKGMILVMTHFIFTLLSYSIFTNGIVYEVLNKSVGPTLTMLFIFIFFVIFVLVWIYNIKEAYYLSIFSSFRDWFEIERVLLPTMGVPENMLISNNSSMMLLENKTNIDSGPESYVEDYEDGYESERYLNNKKEEDKNVEAQENVINIKKEENIEKVEEIKDVKDVNDSKEVKEVEEINESIKNKKSYSTTSALVFMNSNSWKIYWALVLLIICSGLFICYSFQRSQDEVSFQISKNFETTSNNKMLEKQNQQNNSIAPITVNTNTNDNADSNKVTKEQIESIVEEKIQEKLAINKEINSNNSLANESKDNSTPNEIIISNNINSNNNLSTSNNDIISNDENSDSLNSVVFIQGNKSPTLIKKTTKDNNFRKNGNILYEAPDNYHESDDIELVMVDEGNINDYEEPLDNHISESKTSKNIKKENNPVIPDVKLDNITNVKKENKTIKEAEIAKKNKASNKKENHKSNRLNIKLETPEEKAQIEKIKEKGASEFYQGNWEAALPYYFEVLKHRKDAETFEMIGLLFEKMNKFSDALEAYENAYKLGQNSVHHLARLGFTAERIGKYETAQKYLEKAIEKNPKRADVILSYARCLNQLGEEVAAAQVLAVLRDNTDSYAIKKAAEYEYQKISGSNLIKEDSVATE